jgi:hypothetical protein
MVDVIHQYIPTVDIIMVRNILVLIGTTIWAIPYMVVIIIAIIEAAIIVMDIMDSMDITVGIMVATIQEGGYNATYRYITYASGLATCYSIVFLLLGIKKPTNRKSSVRRVVGRRDYICNRNLLNVCWG